MFIHVQFAFSESNLVEKEVGKNEVNLSCQSHIVYIGHTSHVKVQIACIYIISSEFKQLIPAHKEHIHIYNLYSIYVPL